MAVFELAIASTPLVTPPVIAQVQELCESVEKAADGTLVVLRLGSPAQPEPAAAPVGDIVVHLVNRWERALRRLEKLSAPTVALAAGRCEGPALEALLSCDYRLASPDLRLRLPRAAREPWPGMAVHRLAQQLSVAQARRLVLFGAELDARSALAAGLLDDIVDAGSWTAADFRLADGLAGKELAIRRRLLLDAATTSFDEALGAHLAACDRTLRRLQEQAS
jgi:isomerase DpgB